MTCPSGTHSDPEVHARVEVHTDGDGSLLTWRTEVEPAGTAEAMDGMFDQALAELKRRLEG